MILISNDQDKVTCSDGFLDQCEAWLQKGMALLNLPEDAEVSVVFVTDEAVQALNRDYRNKDCPTDVLSFGQQEGEDMPGAGGDLLLGDIVISLERAAAQAQDYEHSLEREVAFLLIHGLLHLAGYDHEEEYAGDMREKQEAIMAELGLGRE